MNKIYMQEVSDAAKMLLSAMRYRARADCILFVKQKFAISRITNGCVICQPFWNFIRLSAAQRPGDDFGWTLRNLFILSLDLLII